MGRSRRRKPDDPGSTPTPINDAIDAYVKRAGMARRLDQASVIPEWPELVGPRIAGVTTPIVVLEGGVLVVAVTSSAWMQELQLHSHTILKKLGQQGQKIRRIAWRDQGGEVPQPASGRPAK